MLDNAKMSFRVDTCVALSNIAACGQTNINKLMANEYLIGKLLLLFETDG
jgi:hypothetical protein